MAHGAPAATAAKNSRDKASECNANERRLLQAENRHSHGYRRHPQQNGNSAQIIAAAWLGL